MRRVAFALVLAALAAGSLSMAPAAPAAKPTVVIALIDAGINPYAPAFRDTSALAQRHPSTYLPGYPKSAKALKLHLHEDSFAEAYAKDKDVWEKVQRRKLYWIPGTKIVGAISMSDGGRMCQRRQSGQQLPWLPPTVALGLNSSSDCPERMILDDHGHGTMTASRAAGSPHSLAPEARIVEIEGLGAGSSQWAADQPWIDVQSNSWGSLVPAPADSGTMATFSAIAKKQMVVVASGNGTAFSGVAPQPTYTDSLGAPGVVLVGGHDNGHVTAWAGQPAHLVADAFGPYAALKDSLSKMVPTPIACCTSTAAPYAAGAAAAILLKAREILGDDYGGVHGGVAASGPKGRVARGPLADGKFTLQEWQTVLFHTAEARPRAGRDDGSLHFMGAPAAPQYADPWGTGENPYCQFCWTLPVEWSLVPAQYPAYLNVGYGAVNERSTKLAFRVLLGKKALPARADEDAFFAQDRAIREQLWP